MNAIIVRFPHVSHIYIRAIVIFQDQITHQLYLMIEEMKFNVDEASEIVKYFKDHQTKDLHKKIYETQLKELIGKVKHYKIEGKQLTVPSQELSKMKI